ncbi:winged helix-turn-helix domain-containing protein [Rhizobium lusitanum]|uniref:winged helix-turn-helix domain-containing protein n=1 Tax=Rhizobium lusitanum TaxID=293958 RepID=UPI00195ED552|nr:winged helix-turn-helix domain-containing protein [Rhizobium lusitanum]MBM7049701.1 winged helix-turn-helix domain-containing protein [Rhizobium lusitanum]
MGIGRPASFSLSSPGGSLTSSQGLSRPTSRREWRHFLSSEAEMLNVNDSVPVKHNSMICPCCLQFVEGASILADPINCKIANGSQSVRFTRKQFNVAKFLVDCFPLMAEKERIYDHVFLDRHGEGPEIKIVDVMICKIRPALADIGLVIETVWGKGYKIVMADASQGNALKEASVRHRLPGSMHRWLPEHDEQLLSLMRRGMKVSACAAVMKLPYMTIERAYKRLQSQI